MIEERDNSRSHERKRDFAILLQLSLSFLLLSSGSLNPDERREWKERRSRGNLQEELAEREEQWEQQTEVLEVVVRQRKRIGVSDQQFDLFETNKNSRVSTEEKETIA